MSDYLFVEGVRRYFSKVENRVGGLGPYIGDAPPRGGWQDMVRTGGRPDFQNWPFWVFADGFFFDGLFCVFEGVLNVVCRIICSWKG